MRGSFPSEALEPIVASLPGVRITAAAPGRVVLTVEGSGRGAVEVLGRVLGAGLDVDGVSVQPPSLNVLFLNLTGRELRD